MCQAARNLSDAEQGFLRGKKYLLMDRDTKFSEPFRVILDQAGVEAVRLPARSPNLSPNLERFMRSVKEECLERMVLFGKRSLQIAVVAGPPSFLTLRAVAKKWQSDAVLVSLSTVAAQADGSAKEWKYSFYSPANQKRYVVTAKGAQVSGVEVRLGYSTEPIGEFIDSDKAMQEAIKNGLKGNSPTMGLNYRGTGKSAGLYWQIVGGYEKGDSTVTLEGKTGRFIAREVME